MVRRSPWCRLLAALCLPALWLALPVAAEEGAEGAARPAPPAAEAKPASVPLDQLLKLPDSFSGRAPPLLRAGATQKEWQGRFRTAREKIQDARVALARVERELEETASESSSYQIAMPNQPASTDGSTLSFRLSQELKRRREQLGRAEADLQDLEIQANLAGVPEDWR